MRLKEGNNYTRKKMNILAKAAGIKYFGKFSKHELALKLGIELVETERGSRTFRGARTVKVNNPDGTITTYPSINQA